MTKKHEMNNWNSGFTMIETLTAVSLFAVALFGTLKFMNESLAFGKFSESSAIAMNDTRLVLEQIRSQADTNGLAGVTGFAWTGAAVSNLIENEAVLVTFPQGTGLDPLPVQVTVRWTDKGRAAQYTVDTLITQRG